MEERLAPKTHKIVINNRKTCAITGVKDVISFDLVEVLLETEQGMLTIKGKDLHVNRLTLEKGEVDLAGHIDHVVYAEVKQSPKKKESMLQRMFS